MHKRRFVTSWIAGNFSLSCLMSITPSVSFATTHVSPPVHVDNCIQPNDCANHHNSLLSRYKDFLTHNDHFTWNDFTLDFVDFQNWPLLIKKGDEKFSSPFFTRYIKGPYHYWETTFSKYRHKASSGTGAVTSISCFETGCIKDMRLAWSEIPPSGLERRAPYFKSPLMGDPILANWQRIWWWRPVLRVTSSNV